MPGRMQPVLENVVRVGALVATMAHASLRTQRQQRSDSGQGVCSKHPSVQTSTLHHDESQLDDLVVGFDDCPPSSWLGTRCPCSRFSGGPGVWLSRRGD